MSRKETITRGVTSIISILLLIGITYVLWIAKTNVAETKDIKEATTQETVEVDVPENSPISIFETEIGVEEEASSKKSTTTTPSHTRVANPRNSPNDFQAGIGILVYKNDYEDLESLKWKIDKILDKLTENNINSISINIPLYQDSYASSTVYKDENFTPKNEEIVFIIRSAKMRGFSIMLRPFLDEQNISYNSSGRYTSEWRGTIEPKDKEKWFETYAKILIDYAKLAENEEVEFFTIGTELTSMEKYTEDWENLIKDLRGTYSGQMTYSANRLIPPEMPWHALDFISIDAFYFLDVSAENATEEDIINAWKPWIQDIATQAESIGKPLVITELGTSAQKGSFRSSWIWDHNTSIDMEAQRMFYKASCKALKEHVSGIYWWATNIWLLENPEQDEGFNPLGKPAEREIEACFETTS
ncbi:MAG: hypothetical protein WDZ40_01300 [Candidatus Spechtbacterales bacterium]